MRFRSHTSYSGYHLEEKVTHYNINGCYSLTSDKGSNLSYDYWSAGSAKDVKWNRPLPFLGRNGGSTPPPAIIIDYQIRSYNAE